MSTDLPDLQALIDALPVYVLLVDEDHVILAANRAVKQTLGLEPEAIIGGHCPRVVHGTCGSFGGCPLEESLRSGGPVEKELFDERLGRWFLSAIYPLAPRAGAKRQHLHLVRDITEQKQAAITHERTAAQLLQAQKLDAVGRLAAGVAHDFNNILTVILTYAGFVKDASSGNQAVLEDTQEIRRAAQHAVTLTRQLLAFSRRDNARPQVLDPNAAVREVERLLRRTLGADIELTTSLADVVWRILIDPGQLEQALLNLAINARDAMPRGGVLSMRTANVTIDDATKEGTPAGRYLSLAVTDTGHGMSREVLARVLEPFFTTKPTGKGTGLGLSMVYGIVKQAGGHLWLDSEEGRGTTVNILLPMTEELPVVQTQSAPLDLRGRGETVLVVDDDAAVRAGASRILRDAGYRVLEADCATAALQASVAASAPDLVLADLVMPGMDGMELASLLAKLQPAARFLYMSGYPSEAILQREMLLPERPFLAKPFTPTGLLRAVRVAIRKPSPDDPT